MRKLMWFTIGFAMAAAIGMYLLQGSWYFLASGVTALFLAVFLWLMHRYPKFRIGAVLLLGCIVGFVWLSVFEYTYLSVPRVADGQKIKLTLTATEYSQESAYGCVVDGVGKLDGKTYTMCIYLPKYVEIAPGDTLTARYELRSTLPGGSSESNFLSSKGSFLTAKPMRMPDIGKVEKLPWYGYPAYVRQTVKTVINTVFPQDVAGFAVALLIGDTDGMDYETDTAFRISGISHIVAVSGFHVTVLFSLVYLLVGRKRYLAAAIGIPVLLFFAAVAGFSASIMRACLMHSLMIVAMLFDRDYDSPTALAFAVLVMLAANPRAVTNAGFQLSVGCMVGILLFSEPIKDWLMDDTRLGRVHKKWKKYAAILASSVGMTVGATIVVTPLCAYYFGLVSMVSVITNLLTTWIITVIFYGVMICCVLGLIWLPLGRLLSWLVAWPIRYVLGTARLLAAFPLASVYTDSIYIVMWLIFVYILLILFLISKKSLFIPCCCAVISLCVALMASWLQPRLDECRVTVLDVGQGQCILLQSEGKTYLVDCGGDSDTWAADIAAKRLLSQGIHHLDGVILTHYDRDHAAGVSYLLSRVSAEIIYLPNCVDADGTVATIEASHSGDTFIVSEDTCINFGKAKISLIPSRTKLSDNESGVCVLFQTENCDILITGDRSIAGERELMRYFELPQLELLIVGHHGSKNSTGLSLLEKTSPQIAIISVGEDNSFGHPAQETLQRLLEAGCEIYRTDRDGTIIFRR